jgi:hypothetical protein
MKFKKILLENAGVLYAFECKLKIIFNSDTTNFYLNFISLYNLLENDIHIS